MNLNVKPKKNPLKRLLITVLVLALLAGAGLAGWTWYDNNVDRSGWVQKDTGLFYKDFHGKYVAGWQTIGEERYFFLEDHSAALDWQVLEGRAYYFGQSGAMHTLWQEIEGETYYFGTDGVLRTGWQEIEGQTYYFENSGAAAEGWLSYDAQRYYLTAGVPATGWQEIDGIRCWFAGDGTLCTGWQTIDEKRYYFREDGAVSVGYTQLEEGNYYFEADGAMYTGWLDAQIGRTYFLPEGNQAFGWQEIDGSRYYFAENGAMYTGWLTEGEYSYYLKEDGAAAVGPQQIDGYTYYFSPKGIHVVLVNRSNPVPDYYKMNLVTVTGWHQVDQVCLDALNRMLADCKAAGINYTFNSAYRSIAAQREILELRTQEHMADYGLDFNAARAKALRTVAYPGTSEHHLGLAVDLLGDAAIAWFGEHCWEYGFIVRYTAEKESITGFVDEPWHFRYVGREVSLDLKDSGLCLEEYLGAV